MSTELTAPTGNPLLLILDKAVSSGVDPEKLGRLMDLAERWESNRAAERYPAAVATFQAACPMVPKSRVVNKRDGGQLYRYCSFEDVMQVCRPHLSAAGIAVAFSTPIEQGDQWTMIVSVSVGNHTQHYPFSGPKAKDLDAYAKGKNLSIDQAYGEQLSYRKRYAFCAALGVVVCDEDSDMAAPNVPIGHDDQAKILRLIEETDSDLEAFLAWCRKATGAEIDSAADIPSSLMPKALAILRQKKVEIKGGAT